MDMDLRRSIILLVVAVFFFLLYGDQVNCLGKPFITWDDLTLQQHQKITQRITFGNGNNNNHGDDGVGSSTIGNVDDSRLIVVDQNGRGDSLTVQAAVDMVPVYNSIRVKIYIRPGIYREKVIIPDSKPYISFIGDPKYVSQTVISWNDKASDVYKDGSQLGTSRTATVNVESDYFCASGITFENTVVAVPGGYNMQAVALRIAGDKAVLYQVRILGTQDTLLDEIGSHYFYQCYIQGSVDFIFGNARSLYRECTLHSVADRYGAIAAHHRDSEQEDSGFSFVKCWITGSGGSVLLGRAWGNYSRALYLYSEIDDIIDPSGWSDWNQPWRQRTAVFGEYACRGKGADRTNRVPWSKSLEFVEAVPFLDTRFIGGEEWLRL